MSEPTTTYIKMRDDLQKLDLNIDIDRVWKYTKKVIIDTIKKNIPRKQNNIKDKDCITEKIKILIEALKKILKNIKISIER